METFSSTFCTSLDNTADYLSIPAEANQYNNGYTDPKIRRRRSELDRSAPTVGLPVQRQDSHRPIDWGLVLQDPEKLYFVDQTTKHHHEFVAS